MRATHHFAPLGGGVVFQGMGSVGLRVDYTHRWLQVEGESLPVPSFTLGLVLHH